MKIRAFCEADREAILRLTVLSFEDVSIDANLERVFGMIAGHDWKWRKLRNIEDDIQANPQGIFLAELGGEAAGYITTRIDASAGIGSIPNMAVHPEHRRQGIGRVLMDAAIGYLREKGMECARIETLEQNHIGRKFYPQAGFREVARQIHYAMPLRATPPA
jgi:ribosomal protein S18 acetylase RimI-like enzyme